MIIDIRNLVGVATGIATALITAGILALLRVKQLYLVVPKLFEFSSLTDKGTIVELQIFNRARTAEEDVQIDLPPHIKYELIASDQSNTSVHKNSVILPRMPPLSEASVIVLAESELNLSALEIKISSKTTKGKVLKRLADVPPNMGRMLASFLAFIAIALLMVAGMSFFTNREIESVKEKGRAETSIKMALVAPLITEGWTDVDRFYDVPWHNSYQAGEFPFRFVEATSHGKELTLAFFVVNKTAFPIKYTVYLQCGNPMDLKRCDSIKAISSAFDQVLAPLQSALVKVSGDLSKVNSLDTIYASASVQIGSEVNITNDLLGARFYPAKNARARSALVDMGWTPTG